MNVRTFALSHLETAQGDLKKFLQSIRADSIISIEQAPKGAKVLLSIFYDTGYPKITSVTPADGTDTIPSGVVPKVMFDESLPSNTTIGVFVYKDGVKQSPTITDSGGGYGVELSGVFTTSGALYEIIVQPGLTFSSGRTFGREFGYSFRLA